MKRGFFPVYLINMNTMKNSEKRQNLLHDSAQHLIDWSDCHEKGVQKTDTLHHDISLEDNWFSASYTVSRFYLGYV